MSKSILVIDTPNNCEKCKCSMTTLGKLYCPPRDTVVRKGERDCSCLLVAVPEKMDPDKAMGAYSKAYTDGWNNCLEEILGEG